MISVSYWDRNLCLSSLKRQYITFTSERNGDGNAVNWRVPSNSINGTGLEMLVEMPSVEDSGAISPDGQYIAYVSTAHGYKSNTWVRNLITGATHNLTNSLAVRSDPAPPDGYFRPVGSPDGKEATI